MSRRPSKIAIDVQHSGRAFPHQGDRGARFTLPDRTHTWEAELARKYADGMLAWLLAVGQLARTNEPASGFLVGPYSRRARQAQEWGATLYLACHVNAGGGRYPLVGFVRRGDQDILPASIAARIGTDVLGRLRSEFSCLRGGELRRYGYLTLGGGTIRPATELGIPALLIEPFFGDELGAQRQLILGDQLANLGGVIAGAVRAASG